MEVSECAMGGITMLFVRLIIRPNAKVGGGCGAVVSKTGQL